MVWSFLVGLPLKRIASYPQTSPQPQCHNKKFSRLKNLCKPAGSFVFTDISASGFGSSTFQTSTEETSGTVHSCRKPMSANTENHDTSYSTKRANSYPKKINSLVLVRIQTVGF